MAQPLSSKSSKSLLKNQVGSEAADQYELIEKLGEGSYGSVWRAIHKPTGAEVAIKQVKVENNLKDLLKETDHMLECKSKYVVSLHGCFLKEDVLWIVMEYAAGGSVSDLMKLCKTTLNEEQIATICKDVLHGLADLHEKRRIHRDIKAGNILLTATGEAKLADFGVSGQLSKDNTKRHTVIGTPFWMAPEVIQEIGHNVKADIWSLGITILEMAEGKPPYYNIHPLRAIFFIPTRPPPKFSDPTKWSEEIQDFLARCLTKNPAERPSAAQLLTHPFITKKNAGPQVLKPLLDEAARVIAECGSREAALYQDEVSSGSSTGTGTGTRSGSNSDDEDVTGTGSMIIKSTPRRDSASSDEEQEINYGTMVVADEPCSSEEYDTGTLKVEQENDSNYVPQYAQLLETKESRQAKELRAQIAELDRKIRDELKELKERFETDKAIITNILSKRGQL